MKLFLDMNLQGGHLEYSAKNSNANEFDITVHVFPEELKGFDVLWEIIYICNDEEIINRGINFLLSLYKNLDVSSSNLNNSMEMLLKKCIDVIQNNLINLPILKKSFKMMKKIELFSADIT